MCLYCLLLSSPQPMRRIQMRSINHQKMKAEQQQQQQNSGTFRSTTDCRKSYGNCAAHEIRINKIVEGAVNANAHIRFGLGCYLLSFPIRFHLGQSQFPM